MLSTRSMKVICSILCLLVLASNLWTMRNWTERTGVYDDICYLRQAHLFQRFGLGGFDTNIVRDDDRYFATLAREIGYPAWADPARAPCHTSIGDKHVIQYPPGTGLALSVFPAGFQRVPLYAVANFVIFFFSILAIWSAPSRRATAGAGIIGMAAIYFMVNPSKASLSMAPTMIVCAVVGYLTSILANSPEQSRRLMATILIGLLLGLAVSFRLPNLFLSAGYFAVLLAIAFRSKASSDIWRLVAFGAAYLLGLMPTLVANAINAGNFLATTYSTVDATPPDLSLSIARQYFTDMQGALMFLTVTWTVVALISNTRKTAASIVAINLVLNLAFFLTHPISTAYYLMPLVMLCLWTLLFSFLNDPRHVTDDSRLRDLVSDTKATRSN